MQSEESASISAKTWARSVEPINKIGYADGASDGQIAAFQSSFNIGYSQGLSFGLLLGFEDAVLSKTETSCTSRNILTDPRRINCQICLNRNTEEKIDNLFNAQEEKNKEYLES